MQSVTTHTGGVDWNFNFFKIFLIGVSHHPHGWCGLKFVMNYLTRVREESPPTRVVWIEIYKEYKLLNFLYRSPPTRVVWIEIFRQSSLNFCWNCHHPHGWCGLKSALSDLSPYLVSVTTHTGGVDWNWKTSSVVILTRRSPPTRVVWIEIVWDVQKI